jgi:ATP-dependent Clp protease ATP-binding subunit ClpA
LQNTFASVGEYHYEHKDEGDFLLFETEKGDSQLVSREHLRKLIEARRSKIDFVFVASCHSNFTYKVWLESGVGHVISIDEAKTVQDDAILVFTEAFYSLVFTGTKKICQAFREA